MDMVNVIRCAPFSHWECLISWIFPHPPAPKMREGPVSARDFTAEMRAVPASIPRWSAILPPESARQRPRNGHSCRDFRQFQFSRIT